ncbi:putative beta-ureidopropionase (Beta-alanine synthase) (N-carbamoyl-beta-alanine amidohydrolase) (PydC) [Candidatus Zixiibacteriota bacterium]|nr:putative beta-ureidopropionase (Beta-alanine synthase) (N-carbamoyl-beta-alanine amidohydrolase) (PydC) [candidate division Zixibacteria bacterium]
MQLFYLCDILKSNNKKRGFVIRAGLFQNNPAFGKIEANVEYVLDILSDVKFDLMVLPELFAAGYLFENREEALALADSPGTGYTFEAMRRLAHEKNALVVYGFPEKSGDRVYNSAMAIYPDGRFLVYQKTHLFNTEKNIFSPGESGFSVFDFRGIKVGMMICFDWRFPESARKLALLGAQVICHPSNLVLPHCPQAMVIRALENGVFTITADRAGDESRAGQSLHFIGHSRIIAPDGKILGELGEVEPAQLVVQIDPSQALNKSVTSLNDLFADRRPEFY